MTASDVPTVHDGLTLRETRDGDLQSVVALHLAHLPHGLFPHLGRGFMTRWHRTFLGTGHGVSLVVVDRDDRVVGFLAGATAQRAHVRTVLADDKLPLALAGLGALAVRPRVAVHFARTRARPYLRRLLGVRRGQASDAASASASDAASDAAAPAPAPDASGADVAVVTALVVDAVARGRGVGARLVGRFVDLSAAGPASRAELITLDGEEGARGFYESLGWTLADTRANRDGQVCLRMELTLPLATTGVEVARPAGRPAGEG